MKQSGKEVLYKEAFKYLSLIEDYDLRTLRHSEGVANLAKEIAKRMKLSNEEVNSIYIGALLHDIGKLKVPESIIKSSNKLSAVEFTKVKEHPNLGIEVIKRNEILFSNEIIKDIIINHHERLDGSGYPGNKQEEDLSVYARIVAVADSYDAMTQKRRYNHPKKTQDALADLCSTKYDECVIKILESIVASE